jgi:PLP dependent protein
VIADAIAHVRARIAEAAQRAGRATDDIRLVVVTKDVDAGRVREAIDAGATDLAENRAQELVAKRETIRRLGLGTQPAWHFIGTLQKNKVKAVTGNVALVHSVDSIALGQEIARRAAEAHVVQDVLLEVNVSGESTKHGLLPGATAQALDALAGERSLVVRGLMTIAPAGSKALARESFRALRELQASLRTTLSGSGLTELSMGMTSDFEEAIEEGATIVRIGTAIFGERRP